VQVISWTYPLDIQLAELLPTSRARHQECQESILDVAMAPVLTFDRARRADVSCTEGMGSPSEQCEERYRQDESLRCSERHFVMVFELKERQRKVED
jgi:hypothetical protein